MKFQNVKSFRKYLETSFSERLSKLFFVIVLNPFERMELFNNIIHFMPSKHSFSKSYFCATQTPFSALQAELNAPSLFGAESLILYDNIDQLQKSDMQKFSDYLKQESFSRPLICGAKTRSFFSAFYQELEKRFVVLDLSFEKPWEKQKRFSEYIVQKCAQSKKTIDPDAQMQLIEQVGLDLSAIHQELSKILTFVGDKNKIEKQDVVEICISNRQYTFWQIAEEIIWGERKVDLAGMDSNYFHGLIAALRYQSQLGYKLASLLQDSSTRVDWVKHFPRLPVKALEQKKNIAKTRGIDFFRNILTYLFEMDALNKNYSSYSIAQMDLFLSKLTYLLTHDVTDVDFTAELT